VNEHLRISDADRDRAAAALGEHFARGRLTADEHAERLDAIWTARTGADLAPMFADLPRLAPPPVRHDYRPSRTSGRPWWRGVPILPAAAVLVALSMVTDLPFWILIFVLLCHPFRRRPHVRH
jgi:hypothetical protein